MPARFLILSDRVRLSARTGKRTRADRGRVQNFSKQENEGDEDEKANIAANADGHFGIPGAGVHIYLDCKNLASVSQVLESSCNLLILREMAMGAQLESSKLGNA